MQNQELARINMVKQQIRVCDVLDDNILSFLETTPREFFVPEQYQQVACADTHIPINHDEVMMTPLQEGCLLQALKIQPADNVLEIGTGTGYLTALLAKLGQHVESVDIHKDFIEQAATKLKQLSLENISLNSGDAAQGWQTEQAYDAIAITGSIPSLPESYKSNLAIGGRLFVILGQAPTMAASLITRVDATNWRTECLFETSLKPLLNTQTTEKFNF